MKGSGSVVKDVAALSSMRKHFKGLRQCGEAWGSMRQHKETLLRAQAI